MTLNDIIKRVKERSHRGSVDTTSDTITTQILRAVNDARRDVIALVPKDWLFKRSSFATVSGTSVYSLASDVQEPLYFRYTSSTTEYVLKKVSDPKTFFETIYSASQSNDKPAMYIEYGLDASGYKQILLYPTPNDAYTVNYGYFKDPSRTDLALADLSTEIPDIPVYLQDALWKQALYYFLWSFDDPAKEQAKRDAEQAIAKVNQTEREDLDEDVSFKFHFPNPYDTNQFRRGE